MHHLRNEEVLKILQTSKNGLSSAEIRNRQKIYGLNQIEIKEESNLKIFINQFKNPLVLILIIASIIALIFKEYKDFLFIIVIVLMNGLLGFFQEVNAKSKINQLLKLSEPLVKVLRDGIIYKIPSEEVTIGDIVILEEGDVVPADARLIESTNLMVDESVLTGESIPVSKFHDKVLLEDTPIYGRENIVFASTFIIKGFGKAVVYAIGLNTGIGKIYSKLESKEIETPLIRAINNFSKRVIVILLIIIAFIFILGLIQGREFKDILLLVLAQLVSAVPEGLPVVITVVLVLGSLVLYKKKALVRYLPSVEALGSTTFICTDKTGTITENKLKVQKMYSLEENITHLIFALCNDADINKGDPLDMALIKYLESINIDFTKIRNKYKREWFYPFDTKLKLMASINSIDGKNYLFVKGAFEVLENLAFNYKDLDNLRKIHDEMAENGLRVVSFGYKEIYYMPTDLLEEKIKLIGLVGFLDPPKESAKFAVEKAKEAGINIIMITGDNLKTAKAVAKMVNIYEEGKFTFEGKDLEKYNDEELYNLLQNTSVVARALPEDKYRIVRVLQNNGESVAVLGDGVNDIPAIKSANLGIAMNESAPATKSVAKMILLKRDLSVIVDAIYIGRNISHNIRKVIELLLATNIGEVIFLAIFILFNLPQPLFTTQILWIHMVTDGIVDKTLIFSKEERWIKKLKPKIFVNWFLDKNQLLRIISFALFIGVINLIVFKKILETSSYEKAVTLVFLCMIVAQWAYAVQSIKETPFFKNITESFKLNPYIYPVILFIGISLHILAYFLFPEALHLTDISFSDLKYPTIVFFLSFIFIEIRKWLEFLFIKDYLDFKK